jgi:hypothetical protein
MAHDARTAGGCLPGLGQHKLLEQQASGLDEEEKPGKRQTHIAEAEHTKPSTDSQYDGGERS